MIALSAFKFNIHFTMHRSITTITVHTTLMLFSTISCKYCILKKRVNSPRTELDNRLSYFYSLIIWL